MTAWNPEKVRQDFVLLQNTDRVYFDNAATSQKPKCVIDAVQEFYEKYNANVLRGLYPLSVEATERYENARKTVQRFIHAACPEEIIFTRNATESMNLVAYSYGLANVKAGDEVVAVNGRRCFVANDMIYELVRTEQYRADFTVKRNGQTVELSDVQFDTWQDEDGQTHMSLGFTVYGIEKTPLSVLKEAGNSVLYYGRIVFTSLLDLLKGRESINNLSGPVGIVSAIGQAASYGWKDLLQLLVLITINLGIFNLLPFPALDGGKVVFLLIEGITGHAVPEKLQGGLTVAAFALLFGLMLFATYNDIVRLVTGAM